LKKERAKKLPEIVAEFCFREWELRIGRRVFIGCGNITVNFMRSQRRP